MASLSSLLNSIPNPITGYRPWKWSFQPQTTSITVTLPTTTPQTTGVSATILDTEQQIPEQLTTSQTQTGTASTTYFFDAILHVDHSQSLRMTEHPVQNGASIVDHAFLLPAIVTLDIGMSDVMDTYISGQYSSGSSKSISAYQTLKYLQALRVPLALATRLDSTSYSNMMIEEVRAPDDVKTQFGGRFQVRFKQIILGTVTSQTNPARPDSCSLTNVGTLPSLPVPGGLDSAAAAVGALPSL